MWANEWLAEQHAADQKRFQQLLLGSLAAHVVLVLALTIAPTPPPPPIPEILRVDLVAGLPAPPPPGGGAKKTPAPAAKPQPVPAARPRPKQVVLPKQAPKAVPKRRAVAPPARPEPIEYEDAMAQLRDELGEESPAPAAPVEDVSDAELLATTKPGATGTGGGAQVDPQIAKWVVATQRHVRARWVTPPEFLNRGLATVLDVDLAPNGAIRGTPRVRRSSGDPFFDDNAVRAVEKANPLPAPPGAGTWTFRFSED